jgi:uncharacterized protein (TIGR02145 family)
MKNNLFILSFLILVFTILCYGCKGNEINFEEPIVTTSVVKNITPNTATCGGNVISDGGSSIIVRGVVWGTTQEPTIILDTKTLDGDTTGVFESNITGLKEKTTYYVRAYATNSVGTTYGSQASFTTPQEATSGTFTDLRDGNVYKWVKIGNQTWMADNLKYLPSVVGPESGSGLYSNRIPYYYVYGYSGTDVNTAKETANYKNFGVLYNIFAVSPPEGWHLPSDLEWTELTNYLGGEIAAGTKLTDKNGFAAISCGQRFNGGNFTQINGGMWWSSTSYMTTNNTYVWYRGLNINGIGIERSSTNRTDFGLSVRCIKNK